MNSSKDKAARARAANDQGYVLANLYNEHLVSVLASYYQLYLFFPKHSINHSLIDEVISRHKDQPFINAYSDEEIDLEKSDKTIRENFINLPKEEKTILIGVNKYYSDIRDYSFNKDTIFYDLFEKRKILLSNILGVIQRALDLFFDPNSYIIDLQDENYHDLIQKYDKDLEKGIKITKQLLKAVSTMDKIIKKESEFIYAKNLLTSPYMNPALRRALIMIPNLKVRSMIEDIINKVPASGVKANDLKQSGDIFKREAINNNKDLQRFFYNEMFQVLNMLYPNQNHTQKSRKTKSLINSIYSIFFFTDYDLSYKQLTKAI